MVSTVPYNTIHACTCLLYYARDTQLDEVLKLQKEPMVRMDNLKRSVGNLTFFFIRLHFYLDLPTDLQVENQNQVITP